MVLMLVLPAWGFVATPAVIRAPTVPPLAVTALCVDGGVLSNVQAWLPTIIVGIAVQQYAFKARRRPPPLDASPPSLHTHYQPHPLGGGDWHLRFQWGQGGAGAGAGTQGSGRAAHNNSRRADSGLRVRLHCTPLSARLLAGERHLRLEEVLAVGTLCHGQGAYGEKLG